MKRYIVMLAVVAGTLMMEPAQAAFSFTSLFEGEQQSTSASVEKREKSVPALRYIPRETAGVVAASGDNAPMVAAALAKELQVEMPDRDAAQSVGSVAVSLGKGGEQACRELLSAQRAVQQLAVISRMEQYYANGRGGDVQNAAQVSLQASYRSQLDELKERLCKLSVAPIYIVFTAASGKEDSFQQFVGQIEKRLAAQASVEGSFAQNQVLEFSWDAIMGRFVDTLQLSAEERGELLSELAKHKLCVLAQQQPGALRIVLVADKPEAPWPTDSTQSLLAAPELNDMDAHGENIELAAWMSAELQACLQEPSNLSSMLEPTQKLFADLATTQTGDAQAFQAAANGVKTLLNVIEKAKAVKPQRPTTLQIWRNGEETQARFSSDACGASFEPGELRYTNLADSCALYVESTRLCRSSDVDCSGVPDAVLDIVSGVILTLDEELKDRASMGMMFMQQFRPQIRGICNALSRISDGLSSPVALMLGRRNPQTFYGALRLSVTDRPAIVGGWRDFVDQLKAVAGALSVAPELCDNLPVLSQPEPNGAVRYTLAFPVAGGSYIPQLVVGDGKMVLATDRAAADALNTDSNAGEAFCGAVFSLKIDELLCINCESNHAPETGKLAGRVRGQVTVQDGMLLIRMSIDNR